MGVATEIGIRTVDLRYSSAVGARLSAGLIDVVLAIAPCLALFWAVASKAPAGTVSPNGTVVEITLGSTERYLTGGPALAFMGVAVGIWVLLFAGLPALTGATIGMGLFRLRVVADDGSRAGVLRHVVRTALWLVDGFPYILPGGVGLLCILASPTHRRLGDMVARTAVVRRRDLPRG